LYFGSLFGTLLRGRPVPTPNDTLLARPLTKPAKRPWFSRVLLFVMAAVLVDALVGDHGFVSSIRARQEYARVQATLNALRLENAALRERQRRLTSDRRAIEALAREEMGFTRRGEILFIVTERPPAR
jgi:cell division protein FtsB